MCSVLWFCSKPNQEAADVRKETPKGKRHKFSGDNIFCISIRIWLIFFYMTFNIEIAMFSVVESEYGRCFLIVVLCR